MKKKDNKYIKKDSGKVVSDKKGFHKSNKNDKFNIIKLDSPDFPRPKKKK